MLFAADLLQASGSSIIPSPRLNRWLSSPLIDRQNQLSLAIDDGSYQAVLERLTPAGFLIPPDRPRQLIFPALPQSLAPLVSNTQPPFEIPSQGLEDWLWFDLYQIAHFDGNNQCFCLNKDSVSRAIKAGFSQNHIQWILQAVNGEPLPMAEQNQLTNWIQESQKYRFKQATVLTVQHPKDLEPIFKHKKLRQAVVEQLSPRHVMVRHDSLLRLQKELGQSGDKDCHTINHLEAEGAWLWLSVRILAGLKQYVPSVPHPPGTLIDDLSSQISSQAHADLEATAQDILASLERVIQGKDQFFPAEHPVPPDWITTIEKAIETENSIQLTYKSLGDIAPRTRTVWPHRLWRKSGLHYFSGWCELAGTGLTFRLDRAEKIERIKGKG